VVAMRWCEGFLFAAQIEEASLGVRENGILSQRSHPFLSYACRRLTETAQADAWPHIKPGPSWIRRRGPTLDLVIGPAAVTALVAQRPLLQSLLSSAEQARIERLAPATTNRDRSCWAVGAALVLVALIGQDPHCGPT